MTEFLRRLCQVRITRSGLWSDGELLCGLAADGLESAAELLRGLGSRCYVRAVRSGVHRSYRL